MSVVHFDEKPNGVVVAEDAAGGMDSKPRAKSYVMREELDASKIRRPSGGDGETTSAASGASRRSGEHQRMTRAHYLAKTAVYFGFRSRLRRIIDFTAIFGVEKILSDAYRWLTYVTVATSSLLFIINTTPQFYEPDAIADFSRPLFVGEVVVVTFFTFDFLVRVATAEQLSDLQSIHTAFDFLSFIGFYIELAIADTAPTSSSSTGLAMLRLLRLARILRIFKLGRQDEGLLMLWQVLLKSKDGLFLMVALVTIAIVVFATVLYYIETTSCTFDPVNGVWILDTGVITPFQSIPATFWFIAQTVTTVGYGDQTPGNWGGRAWTMIVMFFGVLVLSFPNILIGSNFSEVHREFSRRRARKALGKHFRKVQVVVRFVRMWREFRVKGHLVFADDGECSSLSQVRSASGKGGVDPLERVTRRMNFFLFRLADYPDRGLLEVASRAKSLDSIVLKQYSLLTIMQRLLECFSGTATVEELTQSFHYFAAPEAAKPPQIGDVYELVLRGGVLQVLSVFVLHREDESALVSITRRGVDTLLGFRESGVAPCLRCYTEARDLWVHTTRMASLDFLPIDGYRAWQGVEGSIAKRSPLDFAYDLKLPEAALNDVFKGVDLDRDSRTKPRESKCLCRHCNFLWGYSAPLRPRSDVCFERDEEYFDLQIQYLHNAKEIHRLEALLSRKRSVSASMGTQRRKCTKAFPDVSDDGDGDEDGDGLGERGSSSDADSFQQDLTFSVAKAPTCLTDVLKREDSQQIPFNMTADFGPLAASQHLGSMEARAVALERHGITDVVNSSSSSGGADRLQSGGVLSQPSDAVRLLSDSNAEAK